MSNAVDKKYIKSEHKSKKAKKNAVIAFALQAVIYKSSLNARIVNFFYHF